MTGPHPTCDDVRDALALSPSRSADAAVEAHLLTCAACREEGVALRRAAAVLRAAHALEETRDRRAPLLDPKSPRRRVGRAVANVSALAAALALVAWLAFRDGTAPPPIEWSGDGEVTRLSATEIRLLSGSLRFEARAAFRIRTRVATFTGDAPATFRVTLESETDPMTPSSHRRVGAALGGGGALLAAVLFVESGTVTVLTDEPERAPRHVVAAGETFRVDPPRRPTSEPAATPPPKGAPAPVARGALRPAPPAAPDPTRGSCHGRLVFEDDGSPVAHETVWLWGVPHVVARTDADGRFRIENDWVDEMPRALVVGPEDAGVFAGPVALVRGKDVEVTFTVERGFHLDVTVVAVESGAPLSDAHVYLDREPYVDRGSCAGLTGPSGRVDFKNVPRRRFGLRVAKDGWTAPARALDWRDAGPRESLRVEMTAAEPLTLVVEDWPDGREAPVAVHFSRPGEASLSRFGQIDRRGVFVSTAPPAGRYDEVLVEAESWLESIGPVEVEERTPLELRVKRPGGSRVSGRVAPPTRKPSGNGKITLVSVADNSVTREGAIHAGGRFVVDLVPAGRYEVAIDLGDDLNLIGCLEDLDVPEGGLDDCRIDLPGGRVSGRIRGAPAEPIVLHFHAAALRDGKGGTILARTETDGGFDVRCFPFGRWRLGVSSSESGYAEPVEVDVPGGGPVELVWREFPQATFLVRTESGSPVARSISLDAFAVDVHSEFRLVRLDPDGSGRCAARVLPPGRWRLVLRGDDREIGQCDIRDGDVENGPFELVLPD